MLLSCFISLRHIITLCYSLNQIYLDIFPRIPSNWSQLIYTTPFSPDYQGGTNFLSSVVSLQFIASFVHFSMFLFWAEFLFIYFYSFLSINFPSRSSLTMIIFREVNPVVGCFPFNVSSYSTYNKLCSELPVPLVRYWSPGYCKKD